jgi:hypothetical protein
MGTKYFLASTRLAGVTTYGLVAKEPILKNKESVPALFT